MRKLDCAKISTLKVWFNLANTFVENILNKMLTVLYFQKIKNRLCCKILGSFVVYTVWFPLRENQENCVTKQSVFLFALKSRFNVREIVTMYKAPKEQNNNYQAEICPNKDVC